jgi:hypothetical protein
MARTAVIAGTATAVSNRVSRRQARRWSQQDPDPYGQPAYQAPPAPAAPVYAAPAPTAGDAGGDQLTTELQRLAGLRDQGILTEAEFTAAKSKLLGI